MTSAEAGPVVVGVDYSPASEVAVDYAAWQAHSHGRSLRMLHGLLIPVPSLTPIAPLYDDNALIVGGEQRLAELAAGVHATHPDLRISTKVVHGSGGMALVDESARASLTVVGSRGESGFTGLLLGSVAAQVSSHAKGPVVVVRRRPGESGPWPGSGPVLVGVDGSARSTEALSFAFDEAAARAVPLIAVHVWSIPQLSALSTGTVWSHDLKTARAQMQDAAERVLAEALAGWAEKYPQVEVRRLTMHGDEPARLLLGVSDEESADLIVVGSRGRGGFAGLMLGSVSQVLVAHAVTAVAVIHPRQAS